MQGHQASGDFILPTHTLPRGTGSGFCRWPGLDRTYRHFPWRTQSSFHSGKVLSDKNLISIISIWRRIKSACAHFLSQKALHSEFWFPLTNNRHDPLLKESSSNWEETIIFLNTLKKNHKGKYLFSLHPGNNHVKEPQFPPWEADSACFLCEV